MKQYHYQKGTFTIEAFDQQKSFSSFLPGIAGLKGVPIWAFYANRGQAITSFGVENKDRAILDFQPANLGYQYTHLNGFRTFIKVDGHVYEPFAPANQGAGVKRTMSIQRNEITLSEVNEHEQVRIEVVYYALPEEDFGALVREVTITNLAVNPRTLEVVDGLAMLLPSGVSHEAYKTMSNLMRSWMDVVGVETKLPLYKMRSSTGDEAEVELSAEHAGNFFMSMSNGELLPCLVDPSVLFGQDTSLTIAHGFRDQSVATLLAQRQATVNKVPCGFSGVQMDLAAGGMQQVTTLIGYTDDVQTLRARKKQWCDHAYFMDKRERGTAIIDELVQPVTTKTAYPLFDAYAQQNYLDNLLRGGEPLIFGSGSEAKVYHVFSRKHGDPERDYNFFSLAPEYYSQGNGNFRDVNQNRRNDVLFQPQVAQYNVKNFYDLMQLDGYNPLSVLGSTFTLPEAAREQLVQACFSEGQAIMNQVLAGKFTPGQVINTAAREHVVFKMSEANVLAEILAASEQHFEAAFGEGYWIDHWTYNFDLVENYCAIYPDQIETFLFAEQAYRFYESPATVANRDEKFVLTKKGTVRQYGGLIEADEAKIEHLQLTPQTANWVKTEFGQGAIYETTLSEKLLHLTTMKFLNLDPAGIGIQMEANKPGWNDAMNGLPGLFGSGIGETVELVRVITFLLKHLQTTKRAHVAVFEEFAELLTQIEQQLMQPATTAFAYWDQTTTLKEAYRQTVRFGISGQQQHIAVATLVTLCEAMLAKLSAGLKQAKILGEGLLPTYLYFEATDYTVIKDANGAPRLTHYGLPAVRVEQFATHVLPHFLEAPARSLKACDYDEALDVYEKVKASSIYDAELQMYKTSVSLATETFEIGRAQAFTPGWLEREAIFLHMTYKYLLGLLKAGLYPQFFTEMQTNFVCFRDPATYGRSPLENVSFIASSVNPDPAVHGQGFVARLTGATSEYLSMWQLMMIGKQWFSYEDGELQFTFAPILTADFFDEQQIVQTTLFGKTKVTYHNPDRIDTFAADAQIRQLVVDGQPVEGDRLKGAFAQALRAQAIETIDVYFERKGK